MYMHSQRSIQVYVHGDDFAAVGDRSQVEWFGNQLQSVYEIKSQIVSSDPKDSKQVRFLNRIITWNKNSISYEADPIHVEIAMSLVNDSRVSPVTGSKSNTDREYSKELSSSECTTYRAAVARCNFLGLMFIRSLSI